MLQTTATELNTHLVILREYAQSGIKEIMAFAEDLKTDCDGLPDDLRPYGEAMSTILMEVLIETFIESVRLQSELRLQEITREALPPKHQTEKEGKPCNLTDWKT